MSELPEDIYELFGGTFPGDTYRISEDHVGDSESTYGDSQGTHGLTGHPRHAPNTAWRRAQGGGARGRRQGGGMDWK